MRRGEAGSGRAERLRELRALAVSAPEGVLKLLRIVDWRQRTGFTATGASGKLAVETVTESSPR